MSDDELDRIFSAEQGIVPSANFARNVMARVRMEAAAPPPIPFPWKRALPGLVLCVLSLVAMCVTALLRTGTRSVCTKHLVHLFGRPFGRDCIRFWRVAARCECRRPGLDPPGPRLDLCFGHAVSASDPTKDLKQECLQRKAPASILRL